MIFCTSLSPNNAPVGAATAVIADVPEPFRIPVSVVAPVPPVATGKVPYSRSVPAALTFSGCPAVPLANLTNLVALLTRVSPAACEVAVIVLSVMLTVLPVITWASVVPTNSPTKGITARKASLETPISGIV